MARKPVYAAPTVGSPAREISGGGLLEALSFVGRPGRAGEPSCGRPMLNQWTTSIWRCSERWPVIATHLGSRCVSFGALPAAGAARTSLLAGSPARAVLADYRPYLRPGEVPVILCLASDRDQAKIVHGYIAGYFLENPVLRGLVARETGEGLDLTTGISIVIGTNNYRAVRGRTWRAPSLMK